MLNFKFDKLKAFTLTEIAISILILSILVIITLPTINKQLQKTEEYSYYLAYRTVEKMGAQIVAQGDTDYVAMDPHSTDNNLLAMLGINFKSNDADKLRLEAINRRLYSLFVPKAYAGYPDLATWTEYEWDMARIFNDWVDGYPVSDGSAVSFTKEMLNNKEHGGKLEAMYTNHEYILKRFASNCSSATISKIHAEIISHSSHTLSGEDLCKMVSSNYSGYVGDSHSSGDSWNCKGTSVWTTVQPGIDSKSYNICVVLPPAVSNNYSSPSFALTANPYSTGLDCNSRGYSGSMLAVNDECYCPFGKIKAPNNTNVCCDVDFSGISFAKKDGSCSAPCSSREYNEHYERCCPDNSVYSPSLKTCICKEGFVPNSANPAELTTCSEGGTANCSAGSHYDAASKSCVTNPQIFSARRFCELINRNWNTTSVNCNTFTKHGDIEINDSVYNAANYNNNFMSIAAHSNNVGAFNSITPNVVFSNGLRMWILGDKSASIAGLSFTPANYTSTTNVCNDKRKTTADACSGNGYFCKNEKMCYSLTSSGTTALTDARNCCGSPDMLDIIKAYPGNSYLKDPRAYAISGFTVFVDIDGTKNSGTLWDDVFPFYIASNGKVYPGYPLNAKKTGDNANAINLGGNSSVLATDVYYYEQDGNSRRRVLAYSAIPYARAACFAKEISAYTPYCQNLGSSFKGGDATKTMDQIIYSNDNPCNSNKCYVHVKNKIKLL